MRRFLLLSLTLVLAACAGSGDVVEERFSDEDGVISVCGDQPGMAECRDARGETYDQELEYTPDESNKELAEEAATIRKEDPKELDHTITEMEQDPEMY